MCMYKIDDIKKRHRIGYKVVLINELDENLFTSMHFRTTYKMNEWYDVGDVNKLDYDTTSIGNKPYPAGIHYLHEFPHREWKTMNHQGTTDQAIVKIKVKGVLVTGIEQGINAGVCTMICPVKIIAQIDGKLFEQQNLKKIIDVTDSSSYLDLYKNRKSNTPTVAEIKKVAERTTKTRKHFAQFITFIDTFERKHPLFIFFTKIHLALVSIKDKPYRKNYYRVIGQEPKMQSEFRKLESKVKYLKHIDTNGPVA